MGSIWDLWIGFLTPVRAPRGSFGNAEGGIWSKKLEFPLDTEEEEEIPVSPEHPRPRSLSPLPPLQELTPLSFRPQTWLRATCSWRSWAGSWGQMAAPCPRRRDRASPRWPPCATATTASAASPWRQVLGTAGTSGGTRAPQGVTSPLPGRAGLCFGMSQALTCSAVAPAGPGDSPCATTSLRFPCARGCHCHCPVTGTSLPAL